MSLLLCGATSAVSGVLTALENGSRPTLIRDTDYQQTAEFRQYISEKLNTLVSAAEESLYIGANWVDDFSYDNSGYAMEWGENTILDWAAVNTDEAVEYSVFLNAASATEAVVVPIVTPTPSPVPAEGSAGGEQAQTYASAEDSGDSALGRAWYEYMNRLAGDRNLLYAAVKDGSILYSNFTASSDWLGQDFSQEIDTEAYDFLLWFNRSGDGLVEITKDGVSQDVYGTGTYTADSLWLLPGYENIETDIDSDVVIFMAVAKTPVLYASGSCVLGQELYDIYTRAQKQDASFRTGPILMAVSLPFLLLSLVMRKSRRRAEAFIARQLRVVWMWPKIFVLLGAAALLTVICLNSEWLLPIPLILFWTLYVLAVDITGNRGRQKRPLRDLLRRIRTRREGPSLQRRMARRSRGMLLVSGLLCLVFCLCVVCAVIFLVNQGGWRLILAAIVCAAASGVLAGVSLSALKREIGLANDIVLLAEQIDRVRGGDLSEPLTLPKDADLYQAAKSLGEIQQGLEAALQERLQSERMKVELITNVSHDIKTPLTSIISYVDLLKQETELPGHVQDFIRILDEKSQRLKALVQDVFEISKAASGQLPVNMEALDLGKLLRQTLADMDLPIRQSGLAVKTSIPDSPVMIRADGQRLYRVFQNLLQNALQYSLPGSRVFLTLRDEAGEARVQVKNTSAQALDDTVDFTERFVRGDESRTDGGSGLGLSIAKSFAEACGGALRIDLDADLFTAAVTFPTLEREGSAGENAGSGQP